MRYFCFGIVCFSLNILASDGFARPITHPLFIAVDTPIVTSIGDSVSDSIVYEVGMSGITRRHKVPHTFVLTELEHPRQFTYREHFGILDFNRVTGFFFGVGNESMEDFGPHDEFGIHTGIGYGFADKRWEFLLGPEYRIPLTRYHENDTNYHRHFYSPPTLAIGGEVHNITSTEDYWRAGRVENAAYAFFAREDFRDYFKLAGWNAYVALRPVPHVDLRAEWRSDHYQSLSQEVFHGRWGGNKVLPPNPPVGEGQMNSLVFTSQREGVRSTYLAVENLFGDTVIVEQLIGTSTVAQAEFGHMPASEFGFNRYLLDSRHFFPFLPGLNFDTRFRFEASTGDVPFQKLQFLGGPSSLPGLYRKELLGNRLLLLNTEIRVNLMMLSNIFRSPDLTLVIYNDFGKIGLSGADDGILKGYHFQGVSSILYNVGVGIGWTSGIQIGASWRTDVQETPRVLFRLQRPF